MAFVRGKIFLAALFALSLLSATRIVEAQKPARKVSLHILVIEADKTSKDFDAKLSTYKEAMPGYTGARLLDELDATAEEQSSVTLKMKENRELKVTVRKVEADQSVKLRVQIETLKLSTDTTHKNGGTFVVRHPISKDKALFLAVTPKVASSAP